MNKNYNCPVLATLDLIGGKWKIGILWYLSKGTLRYSELQNSMPQVSQKMLTQQLRELEKDGVIARSVYPTIPPKVEYNLTEFGKKLRPILDMMCAFGEEMLERNEV